MRGLRTFIAARSPRLIAGVKRNLKTVLAAAAAALVAGCLVAYAAQTNFLGVVFIADPTVTSRQMTVNADGSINIGTGGGTPAAVAETACTAGVCKASAGNLMSLSADAVTATTDLKLLIFNSATLPSDGAVTPYKCLSFKGDGTQASIALSWVAPLSFATGISVAVSSATACTTKTNVTATISGQVS